MCYSLVNTCTVGTCEKQERLNNPVYWCSKAKQRNQPCSGLEFTPEYLAPEHCIGCRTHNKLPSFDVPWDPELGPPSSRKGSDPRGGEEKQHNARGDFTTPKLIPPRRKERNRFIPVSDSFREYFHERGIGHSDRPMNREFLLQNWVEPEIFGYWRNESPEDRERASAEDENDSDEARLRWALKVVGDWPAPLPYESWTVFCQRQENLPWHDTDPDNNDPENNLPENENDDDDNNDRRLSPSTHRALWAVFEYWQRSDPNLQSEEERKKRKGKGKDGKRGPDRGPPPGSGGAGGSGPPPPPPGGSVPSIAVH